jgi:peptidyl-prolyl cis-trans isomerase C
MFSGISGRDASFLFSREPGAARLPAWWFLPRTHEEEVYMMKISQASILVLLAAFILGGCESSKQAQEEKKTSQQVSKEVVKGKAEEPPPPDALAKVGDRYVRLADYEKQLAKLSPKLAESEHGRKYVVNQTIENILIEKEAEARGLTKDPAIVAKIEDFARNLYRNSLLVSLKEGQIPITDEEAKKYFLEHEEEFIQPDRVHLSLIQLAPDKEKEGYAIYKDLKAGQDFAALAKAKSRHASAARGGDLGFLTRKQYKELTEVAFTMKAGDISKPFKSPSGWSIIKVQEIVKKQEIPLEEGIKRARARMEAMDTAKFFDALMKNLRSKNNVVLYEDKINRIQKEATSPGTPAQKGS